MHAHCSQNTRTRHRARKAGNARRVKYTAVRTASTLADAKMRTVALTSIDRDSRIKRNENLGPTVVARTSRQCRGTYTHPL